LCEYRVVIVVLLYDHCCISICLCLISILSLWNYRVRIIWWIRIVV